jgi:hypothetical protein
MRTCTQCQTTTTRKWYGVRTAKLLCRRCYNDRRAERVRTKRRPNVYVWAGE